MKPTFFHHLTTYCSLFFVLISLSACQPEVVKPITPVENEYITTVQILYQNQNDEADKGEAIWCDLDNNPITHADTNLAILHLRANAQYDLEVLFLDQTKTPADTISHEVEERSAIHLVCISPETAQGLIFIPTDRDTNDPALPLGLRQRILTDSTLADGIIRLKLKHQPSGKNGSCELGSSDADVRFRIMRTP